MSTRNPPATKAEAERDCALVTKYLAQGFRAVAPRGSTADRTAVRRAADELGIPASTFCKRIGTPGLPGSHHRAHGLTPDWSIPAARGELGTRPVLPGYEIGSAITQRDGEGNVEREWIRQRKRSSSEPFAVPDGHIVKGVSALTDADGKVLAQWVKTREGQLTPADMRAAIEAAFADFGSRAPLAPPPPTCDADTATVYGLADLHVGLLTWAPETGTNWDLSIAQAVIGDTIARLVAAPPPSREAVVLGLGDLLHANGYDNQTPKSKHALDVDGRHPKILRAATYLMIAAIDEALRKHEHVTVRVLRGNHDREAALAVGLALALHYAPEPRVTVDESPDYFWWWEFGKVLLGATHGDMAKMADLPGIMAQRNGPAWGRTRFRYVLTGHIHTRTAIEVHGVVVESLQTPIPPDAWHFESGYGAARSLSAITYHRTRGEIARAKVNVLPPEESAA